MEILELYKSALCAGKRMVLATVVEVRGSAYRRPGARLLYVEDGRRAGSISAGCLERDIIARGEDVFSLTHGLLLEYDSQDFFGLNYGCDGVIHVLLQPVDYKNISFPLAFQIARENGKALGLATVIQSDDKGKLGSQILFDDEKVLTTSLPDMANQLSHCDIKDTLNVERPYSQYFAKADTTLFLEKIQTPLRLAIFGAGEDAQPLVQAARMIGLEPHIFDASQANLKPFISRELVYLYNGQEPPPSVVTAAPQRTAIVIMSHNFELDKRYLASSLTTDCSYIGIVGSRKRTLKLLDELGQTASAGRIRFPIGLDIGAETMEEIALSICSEILAHFRKTTGRPLTDMEGPVHSRQTADADSRDFHLHIHKNTQTGSEKRTLNSCTI